jgi:ATP-binding cassette subfamily B protein
MIQKAAVSQGRINEFLHTVPVIASPASAIPMNEVAGSVEFDMVTFTYPHTGVTALKDFSLSIAPGDKVAIIGRTGSGKSTIAHLLLRMYDATSGAVRVEGRGVKEYDVQSLRNSIGYAPQESLLFSETVYNNIKFGKPDATHEEVVKAARLADLEKDIADFAMGYETVIGERGVMLSGGQKQRLVLARALLKESRVLLMDQSLSAVDTRTEQTILSNLVESLRDTTVIVITHRLFTSWTFDKIVVLDDGRIAEAGTHEELLSTGGRYAKLYRHQTSIEMTS